MTKLLIFLRDYWPYLVLVGIGALVGVLITQTVYEAELLAERAKVMQLTTQQAQEKEAQAKQALQTIQEARQRGDALQVKLDRTEQQLALTTQEKHRALQQTTTGRACLNADTVRVLNDQAARTGPTLLPQAASQPITPDARFTTDTDVANWISNTKQQYRLCQARLDALIDFETEGKPLP